MRIIQARLLWIVYVLLVTGLFLLNAFHEAYPDEFDNILGGWYILHGRLPNIGFFTHHGPIAYYLAALVELVSGQSFVRFRIVWAIVLAFLSFGGYWILRRKFQKNARFYLAVIPVIALGSTYWWGQMMLADNIAAFLLIIPYTIILLSLFYKQKISLWDITLLSAASFITLLSTLTFLYLIIVLISFALWRYFEEQRRKKGRWNLIKPFIILALPYLFFGLYLLVTQGFSDYYTQNIEFNTKHYIYNYPRPEGSGRINPIRYAIIIANNFSYNFSGLLTQVKDLNFGFPLKTTLAVGNAALMLIFLLMRRYRLAAFVLLTLIYANARSNPLESEERDYQLAVYIFLSSVNIAFFLPLVYSTLHTTQELGKKLIYASLFLTVSVYTFFTLIFLQSNFRDKFFAKYMGLEPLIYDRPDLAPIMNTLVEDNDYMWIGPFEFEQLFFARGKLPSKYHILLPEMSKIPKMREEILADFRTNKPKVILFDPNYFIRGTSPSLHAPWFMDFLKEEYVTLMDLRDRGTWYESAQPVTNRVDLEAKLFIRKNSIDEIINRLLEENLIRVKVI